MPNEKKKLDKRKLKRVIARRTLTSAVVLSSLMSVSALITANGSVYRPAEKSNGIIQDNLKGKSAVNEAASILNNHAIALPATGAANRFDSVTTLKQANDAHGVGSTTYYTTP